LQPSELTLGVSVFVYFVFFVVREAPRPPITPNPFVWFVWFVDNFLLDLSDPIRLIRRPHERVDDAGFGRGVAGVPDDLEAGLGPGGLQPPGRVHRGDDVEAALDHPAWDAAQLVDVVEQPALFREEAAVGEVVALDPREGDGEVDLVELRGSGLRAADRHGV